MMDCSLGKVKKLFVCLFSLGTNICNRLLLVSHSCFYLSTANMDTYGYEIST